MAITEGPAPPPVFTPAAIRRLREDSGVTRSIFAYGLNISVSTIARWEAGTLRASGPARRLLDVVRRHGFRLVADA